MIYAFLADLVVILHVVFVAFAVWGGILILCAKRWIWIHIPCVIWATLVEIMGWTCPLTPLENYWRQKAGALPYRVDFIEQHVLPLLYPVSLTRRDQICLGLLVVVFNVVVYAWVLWRKRPGNRRPANP